MTQIIACSIHEGIVLATDSRATWFDQAGEMRHFTLKKPLRLGSHSVMLSAGARIGAEMSSAFQNFLQREGTEAIDDIANMAFFFFTEQYGKWLRQRGMQPPLPQPSDEESVQNLPLNEVYLILAGYSFRDRAQPYHLHLFSSEGERISIKAIPTSQTIVVPQSLSMERRLEAQREGGHPLINFSPFVTPFSKRGPGKGRRLAHHSILPPSLVLAIKKLVERR